LGGVSFYGPVMIEVLRRATGAHLAKSMRIGRIDQDYGIPSNPVFPFGIPGLHYDPTAVKWIVRLGMMWSAVMDLSGECADDSLPRRTSLSHSGF
jgi:hypothetical protein